MKAISYSTLVTLMFTIIIDVMGVGLVLPLLPNLIVSGDSPFFSEAQSFFYYGIVLSVWSMGVFFGSPFLGSFSDKIGRKKVLLLSLFSNGIIYAISAFTIIFRSFWLFVIMRFCSGFFSGSFELAQASVADKSSKEEKAKNMSYMIFAFAIGSIIGPFLSGATLSYGVIAPFLFASFLSFLNVIFLSAFFRETHEKKFHKIKLLALLTSFIFLFRDSRTKKLALVFLIFQFAWGFYFQAISLVLQNTYHFDPVGISSFFIVLGIGSALVPLFIQRVMMLYFSLKNITLIGFLVSAIFLCFSYFLKAFIEVQWVVVFVFAVSESLSFSSLMAMLSNNVSSEEQGKLMGGCGSLYAVSFICIGLSIGAFSDISVWFSVILSILAFLICGALLQIFERKA
jgi:MFS family permease